MKIAIIGAGASGLVASIKCKEKYPQTEVFLFDRLDSVGKKIKATGNGKCNIGNLDISFKKYANPEFVEKIIGSYNQEKVLNDLGIPTKIMHKEGLYPVSESASNVVRVLESRAQSLGVNVILNARLIDYAVEEAKVKLQFEKYQTHVDKVIFAVGGKSNSNLGSDGALFDVFSRHGYKVNNLQPGLCPIRVVENVKNLFGQRFHTIASLFINGALIHEEYGEVMFKKDGLSGIVIMNLSSLITRAKSNTATIYLSVLNNKQEMITAKQIYEVAQKINNPLLSFVSQEIASYLYHLAEIEPNHNLSYEECQKLTKIATAIPFTYKDSYDFDFSQITIGGISLQNVNDDLSSSLEKNVYFIGEVLDIDGPCGGYNLRWAIGSALKVAESV